MKVKITVPDSLAEIKLSQYQKFIRTTKDSEDERWIARQMVGIFCDIPDEVVDKIHKKDFDKIVGHLTVIIQEKPTLKRIITYNGKKYGFIPDIDQITVGEQADIDSMIGEWRKMDQVMAVMYRPVKQERGDKYLIEDYKPGSLDLPMDVVLGAVFFLMDLLNDLLSCTQSFIAVEVQNKKSQILERNGDGIRTFTDSLGEAFSTLKELVNSNYTRHYYGSHSRLTKQS